MTTVKITYISLFAKYLSTYLSSTITIIPERVEFVLDDLHYVIEWTVKYYTRCSENKNQFVGIIKVNNVTITNPVTGETKFYEISPGDYNDKIKLNCQTMLDGRTNKIVEFENPKKTLNLQTRMSQIKWNNIISNEEYYYKPDRNIRINPIEYNFLQNPHALYEDKTIQSLGQKMYPSWSYDCGCGLAPYGF